MSLLENVSETFDVNSPDNHPPSKQSIQNLSNKLKAARQKARQGTNHAGRREIVRYLC